MGKTHFSTLVVPAELYFFTESVGINKAAAGVQVVDRSGELLNGLLYGSFYVAEVMVMRRTRTRQEKLPSEETTEVFLTVKMCFCCKKKMLG